MRGRGLLRHLPHPISQLIRVVANVTLHCSPPNFYRLFFSLSFLFSRSTLSPRKKSTMQVYVRTMTGRTFTLEVDPSDYVGDLMLKMEKIEGTPVKEQRLLFNGLQLEEGRTLESYCICEGSILQLVVGYVRC
jgi:large subunit ribosomal protein L40e